MEIANLRFYRVLKIHWRNLTNFTRNFMYPECNVNLIAIEASTLETNSCITMQNILKYQNFIYPFVDSKSQ